MLGQQEVFSNFPIFQFKFEPFFSFPIADIVIVALSV